MMDYNFRNQQQRNLSKLTQLQIVQFFLPQGMRQNSTSIMYTLDL